MSLKNCAGDEDREFFLTEGGFLVSNGAFLLSVDPVNSYT